MPDLQVEKPATSYLDLESTIAHLFVYAVCTQGNRASAIPS